MFIGHSIIAHSDPLSDLIETKTETRFGTVRARRPYPQERTSRYAVQTLFGTITLVHESVKGTDETTIGLFKGNIGGNRNLPQSKCNGAKGWLTHDAAVIIVRAADKYLVITSIVRPTVWSPYRVFNCSYVLNQYGRRVGRGGRRF